MRISQTESYFENPYYRFVENSMLFLLALKQKLLEKAFSCIKKKINPDFAVRFFEGSSL